MFVDSFLVFFGGMTGLHKTKKALAFSPRKKRLKTTTGDDPCGKKFIREDAVNLLPHFVEVS